MSVNSVGGRGILTLFTTSYKIFKDRLFQVKAIEENVELLDGFPNHWTSSLRNYGGYNLEALSTSDQWDVEEMKQLTLFTTMFKSSRIIELEYRSVDLRVFIGIVYLYVFQYYI